MPRNRNVWKELGERVANARSAARLSQQDLATKIEIDRSALAKVETGARGLDALELAKLAEVLRRPIDWFVSPPLQAAAGRRDARKKEVMDDSDADIALEELARDVELLQGFDLLKQGAPFKPKASIKTVKDAEAAAWAFRKHYDLDDQPMWDLQRVVERTGLHVFCLDLGDDNLDGSYLAAGGNAGVALLNGRKPSGRRRFTLAHELGHHLFQDTYSEEWVVDDLSKETREKVINAFAINLLLPARVARVRWRDLDGQRVPREAAILVAVEFGLSWTALCAQLSNVGLIGDQVHMQLVNDPPRRHDHLELDAMVRDDLVPPSVPPRFAQAVIKAYKGHRISGARAAEMLRGTLAEEDLPALSSPPLEALRAEVGPAADR